LATKETRFYGFAQTKSRKSTRKKRTISAPSSHLNSIILKPPE